MNSLGEVFQPAIRIFDIRSFSAHKKKSFNTHEKTGTNTYAIYLLFIFRNGSIFEVVFLFSNAVY